MILIYIILFLFVICAILSLLSRIWSDPYRDIFFCMGKPGSGKSTFFAHEILKYTKINKRLIKKGKQPWTIYSDTPIDIPGVRIFRPEDLAKFYPEEHSVIFIDEISLIWDARNFKKFDQGVSEFMKLHRHAKTVIYAASQNFDTDKRIRDLCTHFYILKNLFGCICLVRPVLVRFPIFTEPTSDRGSDITSGYEYSKIWNWRFFWMPAYFKYFDTRSLPYRPKLPFTDISSDSEKIEIHL